MRRREVIALLTGAAVAAPFASSAQQPDKKPLLIGWLSVRSREPSLGELLAFKEGLAGFGLKEGTQFVIEERWANGQSDRIEPMAKELAAVKPGLIIAFPVWVAVAAAKAAPDTPIDFPVGEALGSGVVKNLARPGGMITGISNLVVETTEKQLELLVGIVPELRRAGFLADSTNAARDVFLEAVHHSAARYAVEANYEEVARPEEIEPAVSRLAEKGSQGLVLIGSSMLYSERQRVIKLAADRRWPAVGWSSEWARDGALLSYGADQLANFRRAAYYVDRILKGANPADLPVEQPTKFQLVINLKTARALGLTIPETLLARADEVIE